MHPEVHMHVNFTLHKHVVIHCRSRTNRHALSAAVAADDDVCCYHCCPLLSLLSTSFLECLLQFMITICSYLCRRLHAQMPSLRERIITFGSESSRTSGNSDE